MAQVETDVRNLGRELRAVVEVADTLERVGSLDQAKRDAESAVKVARGKAGEAEALVSIAQEELMAANEVLKVQRHDAEQVVLEAKDDAHAIKRDAEACARKIVSIAEAEAVVLRGIVKKDREAHALFMEDVGRQHEQAQEAVDMIRVELAALRERIG